MLGSTFEAGDMVRAIHERDELPLGSIWRVARCYTSLGATFVEVVNDGGHMHRFFSYRFELYSTAIPHSQVIRKIKEMDDRRKAMGYRF